MSDLKGTRVYWRPSSNSSAATPRQILKNSGYINVVLQAVQYKASGNFWQRLFHGEDKVTVATQVTWQSGSDPKINAAIQDFRKVSVPSTNTLAIGRNVVLKVPAVADGVELQVNISAIHDDNLGRILQILNTDEFKQPLQLAPAALGQALAISNVIKKAFSSTDPAQMLSATYPGIISEGATDDPVANNRLVEGYIIVVVKQDPEDQLEFDPGSITVTGNGLMVNGQPIPNTYLVYNVSFDKFRGRDASSTWSKKFDQASAKADELMFSLPDQQQNIIASAFDLLKAGSALLDDDVNYTSEEKTNLKKSAILEVQGKIKANSAPAPAPAPVTRGFSLQAAPVNFAGMHEFAGQDLTSDVAAYAGILAASGAPFGFSVPIESTPLIAEVSPVAALTRALSGTDLDALRRHAVSMRQGVWDTNGILNSTATQVDSLFFEHAKAALDKLPADKKLKFVLYAHGGLVSEQHGLEQAQTHINWWNQSAGEGIYPIYFIWKTGLGETIGGLLSHPDPTAREWRTDPAIAFLARRLGGEGLWSGMKRDAEQAVLPRGVATYVAQQMKRFCDAHPGRVELHAVGHSAGAVFHAHFIPMSTVTGNPQFKTTHFLAPAVRVDTFLDLLTVDDGAGGRTLKQEAGDLAIFTMKKEIELQDNCKQIYHQSLLYLIYHAFEPADKTPLLGLEESIRADGRLVQMFGLGGTPRQKTDVIWSKTTATEGRSACTAVHHGDFSSDSSALTSVLRRILDVPDSTHVIAYPGTGGPREVIDIFAPPDDLSSFEADLLAQSADTGPAKLPLMPDEGRSTRRALCVGINGYASPNELTGCVNDAESWAAVLKDLGFTTTILTDAAATRSKLLSALGNLVDRSHAGDVIVFQYSGHGAALPDLHHRTIDGREEAFVPVDFSSQNPSLLMDFEMKAIFDRLPEGVTLTCFLDCCHSGTATREFESRARGFAFTPEEMGAAMQWRDALFSQAAAEFTTRGITIGGETRMRDVTFAACQPKELAFETGGQGEFTRQATALLRNQGIGGITNEAFSQRVLESFGDLPRQHPLLDCRPAARGLFLLQP